MMKRKWVEDCYSLWLSMHKCLDSGVLQEPKDADVGSILIRISHTGGVMSYIDYIGAKEFALYSTKLEAKYGERFKMPESLQERIKSAGTGRVFYEN
jgi:3-hydroxyacyl-CoA dehydrogenase/enoyl-CoA hydratase/3-hydroxybutyryl-CoA epimerase